MNRRAIIDKVLGFGLQRVERLLERVDCALDTPHFLQREEKREFRLRTLVKIDAIDEQTVEAGAASCIIQRLAEVVATEKPLKSARRFIYPKPSPVAFHASTHALTDADASIGC